VRTLVVDDEPLARERLRGLLAPHGDLEVQEAEDGPGALEAIAAWRPQLVFLDIHMPGQSGLEVAETLAQAGGPLPVLVFVTAYDAHALRAFDVSATDYLLKPVEPARFERALVRARERLGARAAEEGREERGERQEDEPLAPAVRSLLEELRPSRERPRRFAVRDAKGDITLVPAEQVDWVDAQGNYAQLHVGGRAHLLRMTMGELEGKLDPERFVRVHRSAIVNLDRVARLRALAHGEYLLTLQDGTEVRSSRSYSDRLQALVR
jgi:two-component system LytT family response regulator